MQRKSPDLQGDLVGIEARLDKDQVGAFALGGDRRHRGMNPELARFIACRRDDAAFARSADRHRLPTQFGIIALFDRRVERVHVDMDDFADTVRRRLFRAVPDPHARTALENGLRPGALSLSPRRMQMALKASAFLAACAKVGLEALIDEATGAQYGVSVPQRVLLPAGQTSGNGSADPPCGLIYCAAGAYRRKALFSV